MYVKVKGKVASVGELATISTKNCDEELRMLCMMIELELVGEDIGGGGSLGRPSWGVRKWQEFRDQEHDS